MVPRATGTSTVPSGSGRRAPAFKPLTPTARAWPDDSLS